MSVCYRSYIVVHTMLPAHLLVLCRVRAQLMMTETVAKLYKR